VYWKKRGLVFLGEDECIYIYARERERKCVSVYFLCDTVKPFQSSNLVLKKGKKKDCIIFMFGIDIYSHPFSRFYCDVMIMVILKI